ncbi:MAG: hypothetical protein LUG47_04000 [Clostridiales bacterium]|nr:hypothetical protein [Clostridiales bacterium]
MKSRTRWTAILTVLCMLLLLTGCDSGASDGSIAALPTETTVDGETYELEELEALVCESDLAVSATYQSMETYEDYVYYLFQVDEVRYGSWTEEELYVYALYDQNRDGSMASVHDAGQQYLLLLMEGVQSEEAEHPHILAVRDRIDFPIDGPYTYNGAEFTPPEGQSMAEYLCELAERYGVSG